MAETELAGAPLVGAARINTQGRVVIPADIRRAMGIDGPTDLVFRYQDGKLTVGTIEDAVEFVQDYLAPFVNSGESMVDALVADRRQEAAREW